jgi:HEAT repeat protein
MRAVPCRDRCIPDGDIGILRIVSGPPGAEPERFSYLPLEVHCERCGCSMDIASFGYPGGYFQKSGLPVSGTITGPTEYPDPATRKMIKVILVSGLSLSNIEPGYSGAPVISRQTGRVTGIIHAQFLGRPGQAFIVSTSELVGRWPAIKEFHDVYEKIRDTLRIEHEKSLAEKLRRNEFIALNLEKGTVRSRPKQEKPKKKAGSDERPDNRDWQDISTGDLIPPRDSYILSASVGTGKTTFLLWLASRINSLPGNLALFIPCTDFTRWDPGSWEALRGRLLEKYGGIFTENSGDPASTDLSDFRECLDFFYENKRLFLLFDGLDQIPEHFSHREVIDAIYRIAGQNRVIITSRPSAVFSAEPDPGKVFLGLNPFSPEDEERYFGKYYQASRPICAFAPDLTKIPMLAYMVRSLVAERKTGEIRTRAILYEKFLKHVIFAHQPAGSFHGDDLAREVPLFLERLSFNALNQKRPAIQRIPVDADYIGNFRTGDVLSFGLVNLILEEGADAKVLFFTHQSFQEYLAASYLRRAEKETNDRIRQILSERWDTKWKEVLRFLAGSRGNGMVSELLTFPEPLTYSNLILEARLLCEEADPDLRLWDEIERRTATMTNPVLHYKAASIRQYLARVRGIDSDRKKRLIAPYLEEMRSEKPVQKADAVHALGLLADIVDPATVRIILGFLNEKNDKIRSAAIKNLGRFEKAMGPEMIGEIVEILSDRSSDARAAAIQVLGDLSDRVDRDTVTKIEAMISDKNPDVREQAVTTLGESFPSAISPGTIARLVDLIEYDPDVRETASEALWLMDARLDPAGRHRIVSLLTHGDPGVRDTAIDTLGYLSGQVTAEILADIAALLDHADPDVRAAAVGAISSFSEQVTDETLAGLADLAGHPDPEVRAAALVSLGRSGQKIGEQAVGRVAECISLRESPQVQIVALEILCQALPRADAEMIGRILGLSESENAEVREAAVTALGHFARAEEPQTTGRILRALDDGEARVRAAAVDAVSAHPWMADPATIGRIAALLRGRNEHLRWRVLNALAGLGDRIDDRSMDLVLGCLEDPDNEVRGAAVEVLARISDNEDAKQRAVFRIVSFLADPIASSAGRRSLLLPG